MMCPGLRAASSTSAGHAPKLAMTEIALTMSVGPSRPAMSFEVDMTTSAFQALRRLAPYRKMDAGSGRAKGA